MKVDQTIVTRLRGLISDGKKVLAKSDYIELEVVEKGEAARLRTDPVKSTVWRVRCLNFLEQLLGKTNPFYTEFVSESINVTYADSIETGLAILLAVKQDYLAGNLIVIRNLIEAQVFDDFLEQAEELFRKGYYQAAAVIAGGVLEDTLRKLCIKSAVTLAPKPKLDIMNADLAKAGVYNLLKQKQVTALADLRNKAAHGLGGFTKDDVEEMIKQVRRFIGEYFA